jgi:hypothetical protein
MHSLNMNWEAVGAIGEVGGAIAVVLTLVYLARQIRHSADATKIAAYHQGSQQMWSLALAVSSDPELADILSRTYEGNIDSLELPERIRLEFALASLYFGFESLLALHERGHIDPELWQNVFTNNFRLLGSPLGREYLATRRGSISRRLEAEVYKRLEEKAAK